ncbi:MAG: hypothetical protein H7Y06_06145 [Opitutaceae bacterium]|nr:hypothetical protein [Opitutaceae bacterium]
MSRLELRKAATFSRIDCEQAGDLAAAQDRFRSGELGIRLGGATPYITFSSFILLHFCCMPE